MAQYSNWGVLGVPSLLELLSDLCDEYLTVQSVTRLRHLAICLGDAVYDKQIHHGGELWWFWWHDFG